MCISTRKIKNNLSVTQTSIVNQFSFFVKIVIAVFRELTYAAEKLKKLIRKKAKNKKNIFLKGIVIFLNFWATY